MDTGKQALRAGYISMAGNACMAIAKGITGVLGSSHALIADAIESTTDVFSSLIVLLGIRYSNRPADRNHPYGHGRVEPLVTFLVVGFLVVSVLLIATKAVDNIRTPHRSPAPFTLIVLAIIIAVKEAFYRVIMSRSRKINSSVLRAEAWHHRSDAITSVTAFAGITVALILGEGYEAADDWAALVACAIILYNAYRLFRPALGEIMDEHLHESLVTEIRQHAGEVEGIISTEKCFIRKTGMTYHVDLHAVVDAAISVREGHELAHRLKRHLLRQIPHIADVLIHVEPYENKPSE